MDLREAPSAARDGRRQRSETTVAPPSGGSGAPDSKFKKKKTRRGKPKRRPFPRPPWRRRRPQPQAETHAPYNNNQFLMEEHMPEPRREPRTRDSSFSVDSEDNYFYPLPEDEEEFLTKEFSSVYEDAQSERLMGLSKPELLQEYLALRAKYEALSKRLDRTDEEGEAAVRLERQDEMIRELQTNNQILKMQVEQAQRRRSDSSADSESDSSSSSPDGSASPSGSEPGPGGAPGPLVNGRASPDRIPNGHGCDRTNGA